MKDSRFRHDKLPPEDEEGKPSALNEQTRNETQAGKIQLPENLPNQQEPLTPEERSRRDREDAARSSK